MILGEYCCHACLAASGTQLAHQSKKLVAPTTLPVRLHVVCLHDSDEEDGVPARPADHGAVRCAKQPGQSHTHTSSRGSRTHHVHIKCKGAYTLSH